VFVMTYASGIRRLDVGSELVDVGIRVCVGEIVPEPHLVDAGGKVSWDSEWPYVFRRELRVT
jgi:hypothetical protein